MSTDYFITISAHRGGRRRKLHTFVNLGDVPCRWLYQFIPSNKQQEEFSRARHPSMRGGGWVVPRRSIGVSELGGQRADLGEGVTPHGLTLIVVLEALRDAGRVEVDLDDLKTVFSQLGSRITAVQSLPDDTRDTARLLLHTEIVRRCTRV